MEAAGSSSSLSGRLVPTAKGVACSVSVLMAEERQRERRVRRLTTRSDVLTLHLHACFMKLLVVVTKSED